MSVAFCQYNLETCHIYFRFQWRQHEFKVGGRRADGDGCGEGVGRSLGGGNFFVL